jgi:hypothetical protein
MPPAMPSVLLDWSLKVGSERVVPTDENLDALSWSQQIIDRGRQVRNYDMTHSPTRDITSITIAPSTAGTALAALSSFTSSLRRAPRSRNRPGDQLGEPDRKKYQDRSRIEHRSRPKLQEARALALPVRRAHEEQHEGGGQRHKPDQQMLGHGALNVLPKEPLRQKHQCKAYRDAWRIYDCGGRDILSVANAPPPTSGHWP